MAVTSARGDGGLRPEGAVGVAGDPPVLHRPHHLVVEPVGGGHIGERILPALGQAGKAHGHHRELRPGDGALGGEFPAAYAFHHAQGGQGLHRAGVPASAGTSVKRTVLETS